MFKRLFLCLFISSLMVLPLKAESLGPTTSNQIGSDPNTLNALQPATPNSLQSADSRSGGIGQPSVNSSLQPAGSRSDFPSALSLNTEAAGPTHHLEPSTPNYLNQFVLIFIGVLLVLCAVFTFRIARVMETNPSTRKSLGATDQDIVTHTSAPLDNSPLANDATLTSVADESLLPSSGDPQEPNTSPDTPDSASAMTQTAKPKKSGKSRTTRKHKSKS